MAGPLSGATKDGWPLPPEDVALNTYFEYYLYALFIVLGLFFLFIVLPAIPRTLPFGHRIPKRKWNLPWLLKKIRKARKHILYAVTDVHDYNGQSRLLTVSRTVVKNISYAGKQHHITSHISLQHCYFQWCIVGKTLSHTACASASLDTIVSLGFSLLPSVACLAALLKQTLHELPAARVK
jgi:hypothetical protein